MATSPRDTYITGLVNAHALENQAVSILSRQVERLESYPEMSDQIRLHIDESKAQAQRLEEILQSLGTSHSTLKDLVTSFTGNMAALAHAPMQDEVMKNTFANFAFEHFEIAAYRSLLAMAELAGDSSSPKLLQQSLNEEIRMAKWIEDNLDATTRKYVQLTAAGQKAGREFGTTTGRPRRTGWYDAPIARYTARADGASISCVLGPGSAFR